MSFGEINSRFEAIFATEESRSPSQISATGYKEYAE